MGGSAPSTPDPYATSAASTKSNIDTAQAQAGMNAVSQYNPYGSTQFLRDANGVPTGQVSTLSPTLQALEQGQEGIAGGLTGTAGSLVNQLPTSFNPQTVNQVGQNAFDSMAGYLQPQFDRQTTNAETLLTNRGVPMGGEAWNNTMNPIQQNQNQAWGSLANQAQVTGAGEQNTLFNQGLQQYNLPYQTLQSVLAMSPTNSLLGAAPGAIATSPTSITPTNVSQNVQNSYQDQLNAYNQQQQNTMNMILGGASLGTAMYKSDKNLKEDREPVDHEQILLELSKLPVDHYRYKDDAQAKFGLPEQRTGPMAQDYKSIFPEGSNGHEIDLADLAGRLLAAVQGLNERTKHLADEPHDDPDHEETESVPLGDAARRSTSYAETKRVRL